MSQNIGGGNNAPGTTGGQISIAGGRRKFRPSFKGYEAKKAGNVYGSTRIRIFWTGRPSPRGVLFPAISPKFTKAFLGRLQGRRIFSSHVPKQHPGKRGLFSIWALFSPADFDCGNAGRRRWWRVVLREKNVPPRGLERAVGGSAQSTLVIPTARLFPAHSKGGDQDVPATNLSELMILGLPLPRRGLKYGWHISDSFCCLFWWVGSESNPIRCGDLRALSASPTVRRWRVAGRTFSDRAGGPERRGIAGLYADQCGAVYSCSFQVGLRSRLCRFCLISQLRVGR